MGDKEESEMGLHGGGWRSRHATNYGLLGKGLNGNFYGRQLAVESLNEWKK